ncbi:tRNA uracil 4-sulfurtransferase ThiI [Bacillus sp. 2205SS5-2]|uniref:tRNA uracil 4-sulfurtransferase ThiI n=1 Tax=Bacillus sp. 2205SS5-2 TaxID=3109031 RepID=UPI0030058E19
MNYERILIRYGELSTKGKNRNLFVSKLKNNIVQLLKDMPKIHVQSTRDRMHLLLNGENGGEVMNRLRTVFGIQSFSPVVKTTQNLEEIQLAALYLVKKSFIKGMTFKVSVKRADKSYLHDTNEMNQLVGSYILPKIEGLKVDVKQPDLKLQIEIRKEGVYLSSEIFEGAGGMPVGTSGKAMLMLSGGLDSPVAGYLTMKRGVELEAVHFHSPPFTSERAKEKVVELARQLTAFSGSVKLHIVPFTKVQQAIQAQVPENYTMTSTRRMMLKITDEIRKNRNGLAIITGESLGQVASQTLESMVAINAVTSTPILRPLVAHDKTEIISMAREIGTYETSILPYEDCCTIFTPPSPKTRPKKEKVEYYESFADFDSLLSEAVAETEILTINLENQLASDEAFDELL